MSETKNGSTRIQDVVSRLQFDEHFMNTFINSVDGLSSKSKQRSFNVPNVKSSATFEIRKKGKFEKERYVSELSLKRESGGLDLTPAEIALVSLVDQFNMYFFGETDLEPSKPKVVLKYPDHYEPVPDDTLDQIWEESKKKLI